MLNLFNFDSFYIIIDHPDFRCRRSPFCSFLSRRFSIIFSRTSGRQILPQSFIFLYHRKYHGCLRHFSSKLSGLHHVRSPTKLMFYLFSISIFPGSFSFVPLSQLRRCKVRINTSFIFSSFFFGHILLRFSSHLHCCRTMNHHARSEAFLRTPF